MSGRNGHAATTNAFLADSWPSRGRPPTEEKEQKRKKLHPSPPRSQKGEKVAETATGKRRRPHGNGRAGSHLHALHATPAKRRNDAHSHFRSSASPRRAEAPHAHPPPRSKPLPHPRSSSSSSAKEKSGPPTFTPKSLLHSPPRRRKRASDGGTSTPQPEATTRATTTTSGNMGRHRSARTAASSSKPIHPASLPAQTPPTHNAPSSSSTTTTTKHELLLLLTIRTRGRPTKSVESYHEEWPPSTPPNGHQRETGGLAPNPHPTTNHGHHSTITHTNQRPQHLPSTPTLSITISSSSSRLQQQQQLRTSRLTRHPSTPHRRSRRRSSSKSKGILSSSPLFATRRKGFRPVVEPEVNDPTRGVHGQSGGKERELREEKKRR